ncbi:type IV pilus modification PilV family protein [Paenisporosarcina sp.]|uniref:type IV pilus modification PilV family protein n=1 Tax=Paenisporosarcina sp. TaxID=1932001 RepID=UPI003C78AA97
MMKITSSISGQKGLTLVEVLAALVILGIVFVGIMKVFPQMTSFNERTDDKLDTMNLARLEMQHLQQSPIKLNDNSTIESIYADSAYQNVIISDVSNQKKITFVYHGYNFEILINLTRENVSQTEIDENLDSISLHLATMSLLKDGQKRSETYGYIVQKEADPSGP